MLDKEQLSLIINESTLDNQQKIIKDLKENLTDYENNLDKYEDK